jgi:hypothetical protein
MAEGLSRWWIGIPELHKVFITLAVAFAIGGFANATLAETRTFPVRLTEVERAVAQRDTALENRMRRIEITLDQQSQQIQYLVCLSRGEPGACYEEYILNVRRSR